MDEPDFNELRRRAGNLKLSELKSLAESLGWTDAGIGKHQKYKKRGRLFIVIPNHKKLKKGTVLGILNRLEEDYFLDH